MRTFALGLLVLLLMSVLSAQTVAPALDDDDKLALTLLSTIGQQAGDECRALPSNKSFVAARARVDARLKAKHNLTIEQAVALLKEAPK